jgi:uncharacterized protein (DUF1501 family)
MITLTRRDALGALGAVGATAALPRFAVAAPPRPSPRLVVVELAGGLDGLAALPPHGDPDYAAARGALALRRGCADASVVDLDGFFGLHPALAPLRTFYDRGECIAVPAVATAGRQRSHAAARAALRDGAPGGAGGDWAYRALAGRIDAATLDVWCRPGPTPGAEADLMADLCLSGPVLDPSLFAAVAGPGAGRDPLLEARTRAVGDFRTVARRTGEALAAADGPPIVRLSMTGFDTHVAQGAADGRLAEVLAGLADGLTALAEACGPAWRRTVVMVVTEFGRSVGPNRLGGTDHGTAGTAFLLGGAVAGGRIAGPWPGLSLGALLDGRDLAPTTDLRAIVKAALGEHLGLSDASLHDVVLPGSAGIAPLPGLIRT